MNDDDDRSSYKECNYGLVFNTIVLTMKPITVVECGVLDGYSTIYIADGLKWNLENRGIFSKFYAYDLWEKYEFKHSNIQDTYNKLVSCNVSDYVELCYGDAFEVYNTFKNNTVDLLHIDISNDGDIFNKIMKLWQDKIRPGGVIIFEGGSAERDKIEWMVKYNKLPIQPEIEKFSKNNGSWSVKTFYQYPSVTLLFKEYKEE
jgi:predicted O-methyltransferase YrrM